MAKVTYLTTTDNPYDPSIDFDSWHRFDLDNGHDCCGMLARFCFMTDSMTDKEFDSEINRAIDEIIKFDPLEIYKKLVVDTNKNVNFLQIAD